MKTQERFCRTDLHDHCTNISGAPSGAPFAFSPLTRRGSLAAISPSRELLGDIMRAVLLGATVSFCLLASQANAQSVWQYDRAGIDGPTASVSVDGYTIGGMCLDDTLFFFADFPRQVMPKSNEARVDVKFATDVPESGTFSVSVVTNGWRTVDDFGSIWFYGSVAREWIERMSAARTNVFLSLDPAGEPPELILERWFPARGSTAALRALVAECNQ